MLLLPIPRFIYTSKPKMYELDIATDLGWTKGSESGITIPGEAYANFSWFGLFVGFLYGGFFSLLETFIKKKAELISYCMVW